MNKMKYAVAAATTAFFGHTAASHEQDTYKLTTTFSNNCALLANQCSGHQRALRIDTPSGFNLTYKQLNEAGHFTVYDHSVGSDIGSLHASINRDEHVKGAELAFGYQFNLSSNAAMNVTAYVVEGTAAANLTAHLDAKLNAFSVTIPPFDIEGHHVDGVTYNSPERRASATYDVYRMKEQKGYYGGLRAAIAEAAHISGGVHITGQQFGQAGLNRTYYGVGVGVAYAPDDMHIGQKMVGICQDGNLSTSSPFAIALTFCGERVTRDLVANKMVPRTDKVADKIMALRNTAQGKIDQNNIPYQLPSVTRQDVRNAIGLGNLPTDGVQKSLILAAVWNVTNNWSVATRYAQPLNQGQRDKAVTSVAASYSF